MNCPYCGKEMEIGTIESGHTISWNPGKRRRFFIHGDLHKGGVVLSRICFIGGGITAFLCRDCAKIVCDLDAPDFDLNKC